jgi:hypothetical protein
MGARLRELVRFAHVPPDPQQWNIICACSSSRAKVKKPSQKTIDAYARAVRRISAYFDCCTDQLTLEQREHYFSDLVASHS